MQCQAYIDTEEQAREARLAAYKDELVEENTRQQQQQVYTLRPTPNYQTDDHHHLHLRSMNRRGVCAPFWALVAFGSLPSWVAANSLLTCEGAGVATWVGHSTGVTLIHTTTNVIYIR